MKDHAAVLGVSAQATQAEIKAAYRRLAFEWHPDRHRDDPTEANRRFLEISEAYAALSRAVQRTVQGATARASAAADLRRAARAASESPTPPPAPESEHHSVLGIRAWRREVRELSRFLAKTDPFAQLSDAAFLVLTFSILALALLLGWLHGFFAWYVPVLILVALIVRSFSISQQELRTERFRPYAEAILKSQGLRPPPGAELGIS